MPARKRSPLPENDRSYPTISETRLRWAVPTLQFVPIPYSPLPIPPSLSPLQQLKSIHKEKVKEDGDRYDSTRGIRYDV
ncbi:hypothetical protein [Egbenema bharatensis]|uniref:hypothetical protein n=1 Tax=Egbenema bharatensis TaxID=3463334 RepID=UPI003A83AA70